MLGTQLLMGLRYRAAFTPELTHLPSVWQWLDAAALMLILASSALLLSTPAFHTCLPKTGTPRLLADATCTWRASPLWLSPSSCSLPRPPIIALRRRGMRRRAFYKTQSG